MEQCSSEQTASYKSKLVLGNSLIDLTGGFGIDSYYFSKEFKEVTYIEQNRELYDVVKQNFNNLKADNIELINATAEEFLNTTDKKADIVYIDPSRRNQNQRVFKLDECTPNIIEFSAEIFTIADKILVKTAPLLDIKQTLKDLKNVTNIWVISVFNDCKEILYLLEKGVINEPQIHTVNLTNQNQKFSFDYEQEQNTQVTYSEPLNYLYEPNASILKSGAFNSITEIFNLKKIAPNTHLYTSKKLIDFFPGRTDFNNKPTIIVCLK